MTERYAQQFRGIVGAPKRPQPPEDWLKFAFTSGIALSRLGSEAAQRLLGVLKDCWVYEDVAIEVCINLLMIGRPAVGPLSGVLRTMSAPEDRGHRGMWGAMVLALGGLGDPGVALLLSSLDPRDSGSKEAVEFALRAAQAQRDSFIDDLGDRRPTVRLSAASVLGNRREDAAVPGLIRLLEDPHGPPKLMAAVALAKIGGTAASEALIAWLHDPDEKKRIIAIMALEDVRDDAVIEALRSLLSDHSPLVTGLAVLAISSLKRPSGRS